MYMPYELGRNTDSKGHPTQYLLPNGGPYTCKLESWHWYDGALRDGRLEMVYQLCHAEPCEVVWLLISEVPARSFAVPRVPRICDTIKLNCVSASLHGPLLIVTSPLIPLSPKIRPSFYSSPPIDDGREHYSKAPLVKTQHIAAEAAAAALP
ncbi:hypothetical protein DOTSEDRAFT_33201 [Dothistroma septosporum NZE10]|uniref:Uncharacterized protein n=1 Tax=Dothistroma septosporum (strain NZE10 / CBS 128990) TaxID=675120 RepID=N1PWP9_DOTSN|nr:hypothetical protein DOTSEDRAFT_33201 [Dothistroma septosporum NZE10]